MSKYDLSNQSADLTAFYKHYLSDPGTTGMCSALARWYRNTYNGGNSMTGDVYKSFEAVDNEMVAQFEEAGLNSATPFNKDMNDYFKEEGVRLTNSLRIQWLFDHIPEE